MNKFISLILAFFMQFSSLFGGLFGISDSNNDDAQPYSDNEIVSVIVQLDGAPLLDGVNSSAKRDKLLDGFENSKAYNAIVSAQNSMKQKIAAKFKKADFSSSYSYSFVLNGFSLKIPFGYVKKLEKLKGVSAVAVSSLFEQEKSVDADALGSIIAEKGSMYREGEFTGVNRAHEMGYTGKGVVVAVLDSSFELGHEAFASKVEGARLSKKDINRMSAFRCLNTIVPNFDHYINEKIPYRWDYSEVNKGVYTPNSDHGSHVAGIIGGNSETLTGVAPDCQLLLMKVFGDAENSLAEEYVTLAALDDAVKLGADVCNLSLSSASGQEPTNIFTQTVFDLLERAGIAVVCSAGNEASMGENDAVPGSETVNADLFDFGTVGSPSTYTSSMSIAASQIYYRTSSYPEAINVPGEGSQRMASYSSWGVSADLRLKPEITAPGSNIYSSVSENSYQYMSGTSMSAPYYAGCFAIMKQFSDEKLPSVDKKQTAEKINSILMSTAKAFRGYGNGAVYSPRLQGAGFVNMTGALSTKAYLSTTKGLRPKLDLGEDTDGTLKLAFIVNNLSNDALTYRVSDYTMTDSFKKQGDIYVNTLSPRKLSSGEYSVEYVSGVDENGEVVVPAGGKADVELSLTLSEALIEKQQTAFKNGFFIDGFVSLKSDDEPELSIPFVAFFGDWDLDMLFDYSMYDDEPAYLGGNWGLFVTDGSSYYPMGVNIFDSGAYTGIDTKYCAYSKNALGSELEKPYVTARVGLLRNGKRVDFNLFTSSGIFRYCGSTLFDYERKTYNPSRPVEGKLWGGKSGLVNGQSYVYKVSTTAANYKSGRKTISFPFIVDNDAPHVDDVSYIMENDHAVLRVKISDDHYVMGFRALTEDGRKIGEFSFSGMEPNGGVYEYEADISEAAGRRFSSAEIETIDLYILDYAYNETNSTVTIS